jgi:hypothetical protein
MKFTTAARGWRSNAAITCATSSGVVRRTSLSSVTTMSPLAAATPTLRPAAAMFSGRRTRRTSGNSSRTISALPSVEALSTARISPASRCVRAAASASRRASRRW